MTLTRRQFMRVAAVSAATVSLGLQLGCDDDSESVKFAVLSDVHLYDAKLGTTGSAFEAYIATDPKLLVESEAILTSAVEQIKNSSAQFVLMAGDMTKDGELVCHELMVSYLAELKAAGKDVYVVPGNHDILNPAAYSYSGDTETHVANVTPDEFESIYWDYGYGAALSRDPNSLSYVAEPVPGYWLLAMDSCIYENNTAGNLITAGEFSDATMDWLKARLAEAKEKGKTVLGLVHHSLTEHFNGQATLFPGFVINDWQSVSQTLAQEGLRFVFSGHFHATDATDRSWTDPEALLHDIETGSLASYPCPWRHVRIGDGLMRVTTSRVTTVDYDNGAQTFQEYALDYAQTGLVNMFTSMFLGSPYDMTQAQAEEYASLFSDAMLAHYAGDEKPDEETLQTIQALLDSPDQMDNGLGQFLSTLWTDLVPTDNVLLVAMD
jgi:3',5'-cyclic AMP phosphodiesterase CpdA